MKRIAAAIISGLMAFGFAFSFAPAFAKSGNGNGGDDGRPRATSSATGANHGVAVSAVARAAARGEGEDHGVVVSQAAHQYSVNVRGDDEGNDENGENGNATSTVGTSDNSAFIQRIKAFIAQLEAILQRLTGGVMVAPAITSVTASNITSSSATIAWTTDQAASSKVFYGTTTPVDVATALSVSDGASVTSHSLTLTGLAASTTYHIVVESTDGASNTTRSAETSFVTLSPELMISNVGASSITSSSALVSWTTNEPATSKVYFTTDATVGTSTAPWVSSSAFTANHVMALGGLAASSTYSYIAESANASGTVVASPQASFTTSR